MMALMDLEDFVLIIVEDHIVQVRENGFQQKKNYRLVILEINQQYLEHGNVLNVIKFLKLDNCFKAIVRKIILN